MSAKRKAYGEWNEGKGDIIEKVKKMKKTKTNTDSKDIITAIVKEAPCLEHEELPETFRERSKQRKISSLEMSTTRTGSSLAGTREEFSFISGQQRRKKEKSISDLAISPTHAENFLVSTNEESPLVSYPQRTRKIKLKVERSISDLQINFKQGNSSSPNTEDLSLISDSVIKKRKRKANTSNIDVYSTQAESSSANTVKELLCNSNMQEKIGSDASPTQTDSTLSNKKKKTSKLPNKHTKSNKTFDCIPLKSGSQVINSDRYLENYCLEAVDFDDMVIGDSNRKQLDGIPGLSRQAIVRRSLEESLLKFPPDEGIPDDEIEEIPEDCDLWLRMENKVSDIDFTQDEVEESINNRIKKIRDYFYRLDRNQLTPEELVEVRPINFNGPYFPTPRHLKFFDNLNIKITWEMSPLHTFLYQLPLFKDKKKLMEEIKKRGLNCDNGHWWPKEDEIILQNWINFQKEYEFYDLRPFAMVRTARLCERDDDIYFTQYRYINTENQKKFYLYLGQGLPNRLLYRIRLKVRELMMRLVDNKLLKGQQEITRREVAILERVLEIFGLTFLGAELIVERYVSEQLICIFQRRIWARNIKLRIGPWTKAEDQRLIKGVLEVSKCKTLEEAVKANISWIKVFSYVKTRSYVSLNARLKYLMSSYKETSSSRKIELLINVIKNVYDSDWGNHEDIDWHSLARSLEEHPLLLLNMFKRAFYSLPYYKRTNFEEGIRALHDQVMPKKEKELKHMRILEGLQPGGDGGEPGSVGGTSDPGTVK